MSRRPSGQEEALGVRAKAEPKELASLLGLLVFCASVIPHGRTYMQGMLRQFAGLEVDWTRGSVRYANCSWSEIKLTPAFWRDLAWWQSALRHANSVPLGRREVGASAITG